MAKVSLRSKSMLTTSRSVGSGSIRHEIKKVCGGIFLNPSSNIYRGSNTNLLPSYIGDLCHSLRIWRDPPSWKGEFEPVEHAGVFCRSSKWRQWLEGPMILRASSMTFSLGSPTSTTICFIGRGFQVSPLFFVKIFFHSSNQWPPFFWYPPWKINPKMGGFNPSEKIFFVQFWIIFPK